MVVMNNSDRSCTGTGRNSVCCSSAIHCYIQLPVTKDRQHQSSWQGALKRPELALFVMVGMRDVKVQLFSHWLLMLMKLHIAATLRCHLLKLNSFGTRTVISVEERTAQSGRAALHHLRAVLWDTCLSFRSHGIPKDGADHRSMSQQSKSSNFCAQL